VQPHLDAGADDRQRPAGHVAAYVVSPEDGKPCTVMNVCTVPNE
jgi:hypothetical protein